MIHTATNSRIPQMEKKIPIESIVLISSRSRNRSHSAAALSHRKRHRVKGLLTQLVSPVFGYRAISSSLCDDLHDLRLQQHLPLVARPGQVGFGSVLGSTRFGFGFGFGFMASRRPSHLLAWLFCFLDAFVFKFCFFFFFFPSQGESLSPSSILPLLFVQHLVLCVCIVISYFFLSQCFDFCCFAWPWTVTLHALLVISCTNIGNVIRNLPAYES